MQTGNCYNYTGGSSNSLMKMQSALDERNWNCPLWTMMSMSMIPSASSRPDQSVPGPRGHQRIDPTRVLASQNVLSNCLKFCLSECVVSDVWSSSSTCRERPRPSTEMPSRYHTPNHKTQTTQKSTNYPKCGKEITSTFLLHFKNVSHPQRLTFS